MAQRASPVVHLELHTPDLRGRLRALRASSAAGATPGSTPRPAPTARSTPGAALSGGVVECETERPLWLPYVEVDDAGRADRPGAGARRLGAARAPRGARRAGAAWSPPPPAASSPSGSRSASAAGAVADPVARAGTEPGGAIARVRQPAAVERQTAAADALGEPELEPLELGDPLVDPGAPADERRDQSRFVGARSGGSLASSPAISSRVRPTRWAKTMNAIRRRTGRG